eukprot:904396-Prorocentrum_minimum.AAC.1
MATQRPCACVYTPKDVMTNEKHNGLMFAGRTGHFIGPPADYMADVYLNGRLVEKVRETT